MKTLFGLVLFSSLRLVSVAGAQDAPFYSFSPIAPPTSIPSIDSKPSIGSSEGVEFSWLKIEPVNDMAGMFKLNVHRADTKLVLQSLTEKVGGKALFDNGFVSRTLSANLTGTPAALMTKIAAISNLIVGHVGNDWVFLPVATKPAVIPGIIRFLSPSPNPRQLDPEFSIEPSPHKNVPSEAKKYDFNGKHYYWVPVQPT